MSKLIDLTGQKFGRLTVIEKYGKDTPTKWLCKCDCGNVCVVVGNSLKRGLTKSCGCIQKERPNNTKHNMANTRLYSCWVGIKTRCNNPKSKAYKRYGARGIKVCEEWNNSFERFCLWAMANGYNDDLTLDRIDVNGNYEPNNCRWISMQEQQNNRRDNHFITYNGETHTTAEWARILGINYQTLQTRLHRKGWTIERAFETK